MIFKGKLKDLAEHGSGYGYGSGDGYGYGYGYSDGYSDGYGYGSKEDFKSNLNDKFKLVGAEVIND